MHENGRYVKSTADTTGARSPTDPGKKFTEPVALSSAEPTGFPLPRTASRLGLDLLALRARCKGDNNGTQPAVQEAGSAFRAICVKS